ncbi:polyprenyl synthetase family protein [Candidatus Enterococcus ferrettii]|uniref:Geranylgeranyl diphosphate synthase, type II n=1 Tax=Candidatus Enterococcus ferrettii TaxID=2815324 RepID=A0ABV0EWL0_9ENTE|nr:farnesyl diphosphate synthase [Enterococcus sp. 665A]MBO1338843.1 polyprenyl synthetase family protein [Enterococcus sp. 665A]
MLQSFRAKELPKVEEAMLTFIKEHTSNEQLEKSMTYSVKAGGKRIRPLIVLATTVSFKGEVDTDTYHVAAALEMIHTYSLIHDDLPAMDDDDLRRGKPTNHKVFGEALAILAGDGLLTGAFQLLSETSLEPTKQVLLFQLLAKASGTEGMVAGQAGDMAAEKQQVSLKKLMSIHRGKTGALLTFAFIAGGILANQTDYVIEQLRKLGQHIGLAFQIRDDLLDVIGTTEMLGKNVGQDEKSEKSTYPSLLGLAGAKEALQAELTLANQIVEGLEEVEDFESSLFNELITLFEL